MALPNHYATLQIPENASYEDIKKAFFTLSKIHHPDKTNGGSDRDFIKVREAFEILSDTERRKSFDLKLLHCRIYSEDFGELERALEHSSERIKQYVNNLEYTDEESKLLLMEGLEQANQGLVEFYQAIAYTLSNLPTTHNKAREADDPTGGVMSTQNDESDKGHGRKRKSGVDMDVNLGSERAARKMRKEGQDSGVSQAGEETTERAVRMMKREGLKSQ